MKASILSILFILVSLDISFGQKVRIYAKVTGVYSATDGEEGNEEYAWRTWINGNDEKCITRSGNPRWWELQDGEGSSVQRLFNGYLGDMTLRLQAFENDCNNGDEGQYCAYSTSCNNEDDDFEDNTIYFDNNYPPERGTPVTKEYSFRGGHYMVRLQWIITPNPPSSIDILEGQKICGGEYYNLRANSIYNNNSYIWEQLVDGTWTNLNYSEANLVRFAPENAPLGGFIRTQFRAKTKINNYPSEDYTYVFVDVYPPKPKGTVKIIKNVTCFNGNDGAVAINSVKGGSGNYTFYLQQPGGISIPSQNGATANFTSLREGAYILSVEDNGVCRFDTSFQITQPTQVTISESSKSNISCFDGNNGSINVSGSGGVPGHYFVMTRQEALTEPMVNSTNGIFNSLRAGDYFIRAVDRNTCLSVPLKISLNQPGQIVLNTSVTDVICKDQATGSISILASQGAGGFQYSIDGGKTFSPTNVFSNLPAGTYATQVRDINSCLSQKTAVIGQPLTRLTLNIIKIDSSSCFGSSDGSIQVNAVGGTAPYVYSVTNLQERSDATFFGLKAGSHSLYVKDRIGCKITLNAVVPQPTELIINTVVKNVSCYGYTDGEIDLMVNGGIKPYKFEWEDRKETSSSLKSLSPDTYIVTVKDKKCSATKSIQVTQPKDSLGLTVKVIKRPTCSGICTGQAQILINGGTSPYRISWNGNVITNPLIRNICSSSFLASATDAKSCSTDTKVILEDSIKLKWERLDEVVICPGQKLPLDATNPLSTYSWISDRGFSSTSAKVQISNAAKYYVQISNNIGCVLKDTFNLRISSEALKAKFLLPSKVALGDTVVFSEVSNIAPDSVKWYFEKNPMMIDSSSQLPAITYTAPGTYVIRMTAYLGECVDSVQKTITFEIPEPIDGDSINLGFNKILKYSLYPNPNEGIFKVEIDLEGPEQIFLSIIDANGIPKDFQTDSGKSKYLKDFNLPSLQAGAYVLRLVTGSESKNIAFIIK